MYVYVHSIIKIKLSVILLINFQERQCNEFIKKIVKKIFNRYRNGTHTL